MDKYKELYEKSLKHPDEFWGEIAEDLHWYKKWERLGIDIFATDRPLEVGQVLYKGAINE